MVELTTCKISSPDLNLVFENLDLISLPSLEGELGVLPRHSKMVIKLKPGVIHLYRKKDLLGAYFLTGGVARVESNACSVTTDKVVLLKTLDPNIIKENLKRYHDDFESSQQKEERSSLNAKIEVAKAMMEALKIHPRQPWGNFSVENVV